MNKTIIKLISYLGLGLGLIGTVVSDYANNKEQDMTIDEKINKKFEEMELNK